MFLAMQKLQRWRLSSNTAQLNESLELELLKVQEHSNSSRKLNFGEGKKSMVVFLIETKSKVSKVETVKRRITLRVALWWNLQKRNGGWLCCGCMRMIMRIIVILATWVNSNTQILTKFDYLTRLILDQSKLISARLCLILTLLLYIGLVLTSQVELAFQ